MGEVLFNTNDVANMLRVDKSTVKRWSDEGKLKCFRTPGGHRKFRADDVYNFMTHYSYNMETLPAISQLASDEAIVKRIMQKKEYSVLISVCFSEAIRGRKNEVLALFLEVYHTGLAVPLIFDHLLRPAIKRLADVFSADKITFLENQLAHNTLSSAVVQFTGSVTQLSPNNKTIVCASLEPEQHDVELKALVMLLEIEGFTVLNLGAGLTAEAINQLVDKTKPYAVCIHTTSTSNEDRFVFEVENVLRGSKENMTQLILSGDVIHSETIRENFVGISLCRTFSDLSSVMSPAAILTKTREIER